MSLTVQHRNCRELLVPIDPMKSLNHLLLLHFRREKKKQGTLMVMPCIHFNIQSSQMCAILLVRVRGAPSLGDLTKPINVVACMRHTKVIGHQHAAPLLPFSFSPGDWNKASIQPPSALTKHSHFKDLSILNSNHNNLSIQQFSVSNFSH